jgi:hypothetical protein
MTTGIAVAGRERPRRAGEPGREEAPSSGLCATCARAPDCRHRRGTAAAVLQCGEFEGVLAPRGNPGPRPAPAVVAAARNPAAGLCSTCEVFATCMFPRGEGGVWRCEEFR